MNKTEWHDWFAWYPVYTIELGWMWLTTVHRKEIPVDYVDHRYKVTWSEQFGEWFTGCWHRNQDFW